ncbi:MAG: class I SAM-dependent methyltransferase [Shewanella sp.]|nr:class I SAM-dependent methyltransferase [Shewanella sp.]
MRAGSATRGDGKIKTIKEQKQTFYSDEETVQGYDDLRFNKLGGQYVHLSESLAITDFLERVNNRHSLLDIPTGTGRMLVHLLGFKFDRLSAADFSDAMLSLCQTKYRDENIHFTKQDIYHTSFDDKAFSCLLSSRFLFHSDEQNRVFKEYSRIISPGGFLIADTLSWSPRTWTRVFSTRLGGQLYTNSEQSVVQLARNHDFSILGVKSLLILPSFFYNFMPQPMLNFFIWLEHYWPDRWMTKRMWLFQKNN